MIRPVLAMLSALAMLAVLPAAASADLISTTIASADAQQRDCVARPATGAGVVQRTATATANGLVRATLSGASGDWDLAVFDRTSGRRVAGSASFGAAELAEGVASLGQSLLVQACRRSGSGSTAQLSVRSIPLPAPTGSQDPAAARPARRRRARAPRSTRPVWTRPSTRDRACRTCSRSASPTC